MEIVILKNDNVIARATVEQDLHKYFAMKIFDTLPEYPTEAPEKGKEWELEYADGTLIWAQKERPLTVEERLEKVEQSQLVWKPDEQVYDGRDGIHPQDRRFYEGDWYRCIQSHVTQANWMPNVVPALWEKES